MEASDLLSGQKALEKCFFVLDTHICSPTFQIRISDHRISPAPAPLPETFECHTHICLYLPYISCVAHHQRYHETTTLVLSTSHINFSGTTMRLKRWFSTSAFLPSNTVCATVSMHTSCMLRISSKSPNQPENFPSINSPNTLQTPRRALSKTSEPKDRAVWLQSAASLFSKRS